MDNLSNLFEGLGKMAGFFLLSAFVYELCVSGYLLAHF